MPGAGVDSAVGSDAGEGCIAASFPPIDARAADTTPTSPFDSRPSSISPTDEECAPLVRVVPIETLVRLMIRTCRIFDFALCQGRANGTIGIVGIVGVVGVVGSSRLLPDPTIVCLL